MQAPHVHQIRDERGRHAVHIHAVSAALITQAHAQHGHAAGAAGVLQVRLQLVQQLLERLVVVEHLNGARPLVQHACRRREVAGRQGDL